MLHSMTGYGRAEVCINDKVFVIEIKSLNGKQFEMRMQTPPMLKAFDIQIRNIINKQLERGSVECYISCKSNGGNKAVSINTDLLKAYYTSALSVAEEVNADETGLIAALLRLPEIVAPNTEVLSDDEWLQLEAGVTQAVEKVILHRINEGKSLTNDLLQRLQCIENLQQQILQFEPERRIKVKETLEKNITEAVGKDNFDANRLEQELIYYIEKIDIMEEQVRLKNHCNYFKEIMHEEAIGKGKKLSFVLQEFGREINTTGSKANDVNIQKLVVLMKDELEKMKEQVLNVL